MINRFDTRGLSELKKILNTKDLLASNNFG